jgi:hypothetical protein
LSLRRVLDQHVPRVKIPKPAGVDLVKQVDYFLAAVPGLAALLAFNFANKMLMLKVLKIAKFPPPLVGMFVFFGTMLSLPPRDAEQFVAFFQPAVTLLTNLLPVFFSPGLINLPSAMADVAWKDFLKFWYSVYLLY